MTSSEDAREFDHPRRDIMNRTVSSIATDSEASLHEVIGNDATATFEEDPAFTESNPAGAASSDNVQVQRAADLDEDDDLDEDEDDEDEDDEDLEDEDIDDEDLEDDDLEDDDEDDDLEDEDDEDEEDEDEV
jgi:hypothetical protein